MIDKYSLTPKREIPIPQVDPEDEDNFHVCGGNHPTDPTKVVYEAVYFMPIVYREEIEKLFGEENIQKQRVEWVEKAIEKINFKMKKMARAIQ